MRSLNTQSPILPALSLMVAAMLWGLLWLPLRSLDAAGLSGTWTTVIAYATALTLALPWVRDWGSAMARHPGFYVALALASGWCNLAFILAMLEGSVVRVLILFYLSPIWTVLLGFLLLGERPSSAAVVVLLMALVGAALMLWHPEIGLPWPEGAGDWLAISSGMAFALANVLIRRGRGLPSVGAKLVAAWLGCGVLALAWLSISSPALPVTSGAAVAGAVALGAFGLVLATLSVQYGVSRLPVHRSAVILLFEVLVGAVSAELWTDEVLHLREWLGAALIVIAAWLAARAS